LRQVASAFPEDGVVSAKTVEIHDLNTITCTGVAKDNSALSKTIEKLGSSPGITDLHEVSQRGKAPNIQFTLNFSWTEGGGRSAN